MRKLGLYGTSRILKYDQKLSNFVNVFFFYFEIQLWLFNIFNPEITEKLIISRYIL